MRGMLQYMAARIHLIYIPGLGDRRVYGQRLAVAAWRLWGVTAEVVQMRWDDHEPWESKLGRLLARIDVATGAGRQVALVGASAGAAAAVHAYARRSQALVGCVLIAGKVNRPETVAAWHAQAHPAFVQAIAACPALISQLDPASLARIQCRYAANDMVLVAADSDIPGTQHIVLPSLPHPVTIGIQLVFGAPLFIGFLRRITKADAVRL
jgi:predicted alpha/beta hydrolase family esterase